MDKALLEAGITADEFSACWSNKVKILTKTERGKRQLVTLLKKGGFHLGKSGSAQARLRQKILFVKEVAGRDTSEKAQTTASTSVRVCLSVCVYDIRILYACVSIYGMDA